MAKALILILSAFLSTGLLAQEFAAMIGVHQTDADTDIPNASIDGVMNFKAGLGVRFDLMENSYFRTGVLYSQRNLEVAAGAATYDLNLSYLDVPALYQYNFNDTFALFGGLVVAVNVNDELEPTIANYDPDVETLTPLITLGTNLTFNDMIGFDFYYERGVGSIGNDLETFNSFGANFLYWF